MRLINLSRLQVWVGRRRNRPITYEDLVDAETRVLMAEESEARFEMRVRGLARRLHLDARPILYTEEGTPYRPKDVAGDEYARGLDDAADRIDAELAAKDRLTGDRPVVYVREQEGSVTELFATVEEAMDGPWDFEPSLMGDPWQGQETDPDTGLTTAWSACPKGEAPVYIWELAIPAGCEPHDSLAAP